MLAKTKLNFSGVIGTNKSIDEEMLGRMLFELENDFNTKHPDCRLHILEAHEAYKEE